MFGVDEWSVAWFNFVLYWVWTALRIAIDPLIPRSWLNPDAWPFRLSKWEGDGAFYRKVLHIERWKDHLPVFAGRTGFDKKSLLGIDPEYLSRFITETCRGESNHLRAIGSVVVMRLWTPFGVWIWLFLIAAAGNLPFVAIQRYNRPRLQRILDLCRRNSSAISFGDRGLRAEPA